MAKDLVCGMNVDENKAIAVVHGGKTYYFCSTGCKSTFAKSPAKYTGQ